MTHRFSAYFYVCISKNMSVPVLTLYKYNEKEYLWQEFTAIEYNNGSCQLSQIGAISFCVLL